MFYHNLPGGGLGRRASSLIAYGLGTPFVEVAEAVQVYHGGGGRYVSRLDWDDIIADNERRDRIMAEDEEVLQIIIEAIFSGVLD